MAATKLHNYVINCRENHPLRGFEAETMFTNEHGSLGYIPTEDGRDLPMIRGVSIIRDKIRDHIARQGMHRPIQNINRNA